MNQAPEAPPFRVVHPDQTPRLTLRDRVLHGREILTKAPRVTSLVAGLFSTSSLVMVYGAPGSLKSFIALDLAVCVATGQPFHGRQVLSGPAVYIVAEGSSGIAARVDAFLDANPGLDITGVTWVIGAVVLTDSRHVAELIELVTEIAPALVVIDTLSRCTPGVEENSAKDMGGIVATLDGIRQACGAAVVVVHHAGKDSERGLRGSSVLAGAADTILHTVRTRTGASLSCTKQKDAEDGLVQRFRIEPRRNSVILVLDETDGQEPVFRPTWLMQALSAVIVQEPGLSGRALTEDRLLGRSRDGKRAALRALVDEGFVRVEPGSRSSLQHFSVRPFHQETDDAAG